VFASPGFSESRWKRSSAGRTSTRPETLRQRLPRTPRRRSMTRHSLAPLAGSLYLATVPTTGFAYGYVAFMPEDDPAALLAALQLGRQALDWSILLGAIGFVIYLLLAAAFHRLLSPVSKIGADLLVLFVAASVPLALMGMAYRMDLIALLEAARGQLPAEGMALLQSEAHLFQLCSS